MQNGTMTFLGRGRKEIQSDGLQNHCLNHSSLSIAQLCLLLLPLSLHGRAVRGNSYKSKGKCTLLKDHAVPLPVFLTFGSLECSKFCFYQIQSSSIKLSRIPLNYGMTFPISFFTFHWNNIDIVCNLQLEIIEEHLQEPIRTSATPGNFLWI